MTTLGTILPTASSNQVNTRYRQRVDVQKDAIAAKVMHYTDQRIVGGEKQYVCRENPAVYGIITDSLDVRWFVSRDDGDYSIKCRDSITPPSHNRYFYSGV